MLTSAQLIEIGVKPGPLFGQLLKCDTIEQAREILAQQPSKPTTVKRSPVRQGSVLFWLLHNPWLQGMASVELPGVAASNSEKRRWLENKSVEINGGRPLPDDDMPFEIASLVFFPEGKRKCTMV